MNPRSPAKPQHCTASTVTTASQQRPAIATSLSRLPILRTLHTGWTATGPRSGVIVRRGSRVSWTNSMLSWIASDPASIFFIRYVQGLVSKTIGQRPFSLASRSARASSDDFWSAASTSPLLSNGWPQHRPSSAAG